MNTSLKLNLWAVATADQCTVWRDRGFGHSYIATAWVVCAVCCIVILTFSIKVIRNLRQFRVNTKSKGVL